VLPVQHVRLFDLRHVELDAQPRLVGDRDCAFDDPERLLVKRTGYVPNLLAGGLRSAKSRLVAAVVPTISGPVFQAVIQALTDALDERGYQLLIGQSGYKTSREDALLDAIIGRRPIGIVFTGMMHSVEGQRRLVAAGIPIVETWDLSKPPIDMAVGFSHDAVGEAVCEYLVRKGQQTSELTMSVRLTRRAQSLRSYAFITVVVQRCTRSARARVSRGNGAWRSAGMESCDQPTYNLTISRSITLRSAGSDSIATAAPAGAVVCAGQAIMPIDLFAITNPIG